MRAVHETLRQRADRGWFGGQNINDSDSRRPTSLADHETAIPLQNLPSVRRGESGDSDNHAL